MTTVIAIIGALAVASIPLMLGWRRTSGEAQMVSAMGLKQPEKRFNPEKWALRTGTGLTFNQIALGVLLWVAGGFIAGTPLGIFSSVLFAAAGGLLYVGVLVGKRQDIRLNQARDILRALGVMETLLSQGRPLLQAVEEAASAVGPDGQRVLQDLVVRMRAAPADRTADAVRDWTQDWSNPAVNVVGTAILSALEARIEIGPLIASLRKTLSGVVNVLSSARAKAKGIEWQARFLTLWPPGILAFMGLTSPFMGLIYSESPGYLLPVMIGAGLSYILSMRKLSELSIEASMGLQGGAYMEISLDRMGRVL